MADDRYFGYTTQSNTQLNDLKKWSRRTGDDLTHYPQTDSSQNYTPTPNWNDPKYVDETDSDKYEQNWKDQAADTIEKIRWRIMGQDVVQIDALSQQWFAIVMIIENLSDNIFNEATALRSGGNGGHAWTGPASDAFLARGPGAALKSLDDWKSAAVTNWLGLSYLSSTVVDHQSKMTDLYDKYKAAMVSASNEFLQGDPQAAGDNPDLYVQWLRKSAEPWHQQAQGLEYAMAQGYWQVINSHLNGGSGGTIFEGPTDAVKPDPKFMGPPPPTMPHLGTPPNLGAMGLPPDLPNLPPVDAPPEPPLADLSLTNPDLTAPPDPSQLQSGHPDGQALTNPAGQVPNLDVTLTAGLTLTATASFTASADLTGLTGTAPGVSGPGGMGNLARGLTPPAMPPKLKKGTLGRSATPGEPEGGPGRGAPATPGALRNRVNKAGQERPGAPGFDEGEEFGRPGQTGTPPVLRGRRSGGGRPDTRLAEEEARLNRSGTPTRPGAAPPVLNRKRQDKAGTGVPGGAAAGPLDEEFGRPGQPGTSAPVLRGSRPATTGPEEVEPPARAVRGAVRSSAAEQQEMASRRKTREEREKERIDKEFAQIQRLLADEEPWTVATPGGAVLDNAPERAVYQVEPKPTLGGHASA